MVRRLTLGLVVALVLTGLPLSTGAASPPPKVDSSGPLAVYTGVVDTAGLQAIVALGVDRHELQLTSLSDGQAQVEVVLTGAQADTLAASGADLSPKSSAAARRVSVLQEGVFRRYSGPGGIQEEL